VKVWILMGGIIQGSCGLERFRGGDRISSGRHHGEKEEGGFRQFYAD